MVDTVVANETRDAPPRSLVDRALSILDAFRNESGSLSLSDIARRADLPIATCFRIVQRLVTWGALERDAENHYRIGLRLWEIASLAPRSVGLQRIARPHLLALYEATGCAAHLAVRAGVELVSIDRIQNPRWPSARPLSANRYPMHPTAIGLILLAHAPAHVRRRVLDEPLESFTQNTVTDPTRLQRAIDEIRIAGYAVTDRQVDLHHVSIAAPVRSSTGDVIASLSLSFRSEATSDQFVPIVCHSAAMLGRAIARAGDEAL